MRRFSALLAGAAGVALGLLAAGSAPVWANERRGPLGPDEDGTKPALVKIAGEGLMESHAFQFLMELSDDVGARVTGSPEERKAEEWGVAKMKSIGLENVHTEKYQIWRGWKRGTAEAELLSPMRHKLHVDAMGWTGSTPASGVEGEIVSVNLFDIDNEIKNVARLKGKIALMVMKGQPRASFTQLFLRFGDYLRAAGQAGVLAVIGGQAGVKSAGMNLTHTGILGFDADFPLPVVSMTAEDQSQLERYLDRGMTPRARFNVQNSFTNGPVESANVVGEIRGREKPDQILVVGGHLDSWDLAQGATDNGSGTASVLGAADSIMRSGQRPRRTIRFVLFTGEEQGLNGSKAYVQAHKDELGKISGVLIHDSGTGKVLTIGSMGNYGARETLGRVLYPLAEPVGIMEPSLRSEGGTDHIPFDTAGVPGFWCMQEIAEYDKLHHSQADTLEHVRWDDLTEGAQVLAVFAYNVAELPDLLPRKSSRQEK